MPEAAGANCAAGGIAIQTGIDANGSGVLDPEEVASTSYVCNGVDGADGAQALVNLAAEPAGANCAAGGTAVESGIDSNRNGILDADEITSTTYLCNPPPGCTTPGYC